MARRIRREIVVTAEPLTADERDAHLEVLRTPPGPDDYCVVCAELWPCRFARATPTPDTPAPSDLIHEAWAVIANAGGGDWSKETTEWRSAAANFSDKMHAATRVAPPPDTRLREALTSWYAADGESWRLVAMDRDGGIVAAGIPEALLDAIIRRATREETT